ncbi:MAG TPA: GAF domain-containing protein [Candidatus Krumholzibacteria bacterium]|nr:GAF domain-containing protein [Candidatus Krumholzibacteria bacterium]
MGNRHSRMVVGTWLVVWGILLLLVSNHVLLGWKHLWPCILVVSGVVMLRVLQNRLSFAAIFAGTWTILLGIFLTLFSFGFLDWGIMRTLWPIIPMIVGVSFVVAGATRPPTSAGIVVGSMVILMGSACLLYEMGTISARVAQPFLRWWPLVLVMAGFVLMKRDARVRESSVSVPRTGSALHSFEQGALSTDVENAILRRVRGAGGSRDAAIALISELKNRFERFSWVGIYRLQGDLLSLDDAEFVGPSPQHRRIPISEGVCGAAARERQTIVVPDVCADERYLACSPTVKSEIVVPILDRGAIVGVLDIDSDRLDAFTEDDRRFLEALVAKIAYLLRDENMSVA